MKRREFLAAAAPIAAVPGVVSYAPIVATPEPVTPKVSRVHTFPEEIVAMVSFGTGLAVATKGGALYVIEPDA